MLVNKKVIIPLMFLFVFLLNINLIYNQKPYKNVKKDLVPDKETAIKIAEAIWLPIYGESIFTKKPYIVKEKKTLWIVEGSLPDGYDGGVPYIEIQKSDCKIINLKHGK